MSQVDNSLASQKYPVQFEGHLDSSLSRGLWLVKWFLAIPHFVVLAFLWLAFLVLTVVAGFAILFTGRYPHSIFDFNVGIVRWGWRVTFYAFVLGTDKYPPFALKSDASYPADLEIEYPEQLSRGLVLVKWWLLAIPQYVIVSFFSGGSTMIGCGLIGVCALFAGVILLFTRRYPLSLFDFIMGMERWTYRVIGYAALMRDEYPPMRFDSGPDEEWQRRRLAEAGV